MRLKSKLKTKVIDCTEEFTTINCPSCGVNDKKNCFTNSQNRRFYCCSPCKLLIPRDVHVVNSNVMGLARTH
eukprot:Pgem_evm2s18640